MICSVSTESSLAGTTRSVPEVRAEYILLGSGCPELQRLRGYIVEAYRRHRGTHPVIHELEGIAQITEVVRGETRRTSVLMIAHGSEQGIVQRGSPLPDEAEYLTAAWWKDCEMIGMLYLLGCFTTHAIGIYKLTQVCDGAVGYGNLTVFYDGHPVGKSVSTRLVNDIIGSWATQDTADGLYVAVLGQYDATLRWMHGRRWFLQSCVREVKRFMQLLIGLQMDGLKRAP